jgi:hypothetical protein
VFSSTANLTYANSGQQICNFTNAIFFWAFLPETAKRPLEEMNHLFRDAPLFVPGMKASDFAVDLERRVEEVEVKQGIRHREHSL